MTPSAASLARLPPDVRRAMLTSPELFLRDIDPLLGRAVFTPMKEASYRSSAFLDNRLARAGTKDLIVDLDDLIELTSSETLQRPVIHYLFHVGHCGSTLVSRLLGERNCYLALREPPLLMGLARSLRALDRPGFPISRQRWETLKELSLLMLGKTWRNEQTALVKPTSHAGNLIPDLLRHTGLERAIFLYVDLEVYLATMLRPANRRETRLFASDFRAREFSALVDGCPESSDEYSDAELVTLTWFMHAREMAAALGDPDVAERCLLVHFEDFLAEPAASYGQLCEFLGTPLRDDERETVASGPWLSRSSKAPGEAFGRKQREEALAASRTRHAGEVEAGLAWAETLARTTAFSGLLHRLGPARARPALP